MKKRTFLLATLFASAFVFTGCNDNSDLPDYTPPPFHDENLRAIVVSEGQFGYGTSSLTSLSQTGEVEQDLFRKVNDRPMGDVAQSITRIGNYYYVPLNNSRKIEVFDAETFKSVETMSIDKSNMIPMYATDLGNNQVFVTNQNSKGDVIVMDINHGTDRKLITNSFKLGYRTFQSRVIGNKLFVGGDLFWAFDLNNISADGARRLRYQSERLANGDGRLIQLVDFSKIVVDKHNHIWVLSSFLDGETYKDRSYLVCIDPQTEETVHEIDITSLGVNSWVDCIDISPDLSTIYFNTQRKLYSVSVDAPVSPEAPLFTVDRSGKTVYHMAVSKENTVFLIEVLYGSLERSDVYEYDPKTGAELQKFTAGIFSHHIYFN